MRKGDLTLDNLLTWKDVIALGDPRGAYECYLGKEVLKDCCDTKEDRKKLEENFKKYIYDKFKARFSDVNIPIEKIDIRLVFAKDSEDNWRITYSIPHFASSFYEYMCSGHEAEVDATLLNLMAVYDGNLELPLKAVFDSLNEKYREAIREIRNNASSVGNLYKYQGNGFNMLLEEKRTIKWCRDHVKDLIEFFSSDYPLEVLESINKDKFILNLVACTSSNKEIREYFLGMHDIDEFSKKLDNPVIINILNYANNYKLMIDYLEQENNTKYNLDMRLHSKKLGSAVIPSAEVLESFEKINEPLRNNLEYSKKIGYFKTYEELLAARASETWKKIQNKRLVESIKISFDMIESGSNIKLDRSSVLSQDVVFKGKSDKSIAKLKKQYDLLDDKLKYYGSKTPVIELVGISNFVGYFAQFYQNGCVVLDKLCRSIKLRDGSKKLLPAKEDAIYIMNYKEFANFCTYTKPELIEEKCNFNPNIDRHYHTKNWMITLDKIISGAGYGELDLDFLDKLISELSIDTSDELEKEANKILEKKKDEI